MGKPPDSDNLLEALLYNLNSAKPPLCGLFAKDPSNLVFKGLMPDGTEYDLQMSSFVREAVGYVYNLDIARTLFTTKVKNTGNGTVAWQIGLNIPELLADSSSKHREGWFFLCAYCGARSSAYATDLSQHALSLLSGLKHKSASYRYYKRKCTSCGKEHPGNIYPAIDDYPSVSMQPTGSAYTAPTLKSQEGFPPAAIALRTGIELKKLGYLDETSILMGNPYDVCPKLFYGTKSIERTAKYAKLKREALTLGKTLCPAGLGDTPKVLMNFIYRLVNDHNKRDEPLSLELGLVKLVSIGMVVADFLRFIENANFITKDSFVVHDIWYFTPDYSAANGFDLVDVVTSAMDVMTLATDSVVNAGRLENQKIGVASDLKIFWPNSLVDELIPKADAVLRAYYSAIYDISGISKLKLVHSRLKILAVHSEKQAFHSLDGSRTPADFLNLYHIPPDVWCAAEWMAFDGVLLHDTDPVKFSVEDSKIKACVMHEGISLHDTMHLAEHRYVMLTSFRMLAAYLLATYGAIDLGNFIYRLILEQQTVKKRDIENYTKTLADLLKEDL